MKMEIILKFNGQYCYNNIPIVLELFLVLLYLMMLTMKNVGVLMIKGKKLKIQESDLVNIQV